MSDWQPIETAPRDGTRVILAVPHFESGWNIGEAYFDPEHPAEGDWWWAGTSDGDYFASSLLDCNHNRPTHWMPLPPSPSPASEPTVHQIEGYIALALHDIEELRGPQREGVQVFREFFKAMQARTKPQEIDWGKPKGRETI